MSLVILSIVLYENSFFPLFATCIIEQLKVRTVPRSTRNDRKSAYGHGDGDGTEMHAHLDERQMPKQPALNTPGLDIDMLASWTPGPRVRSKSTENNQLNGQQSHKA